jgi:hypothetical protein
VEQALSYSLVTEIRVMCYEPSGNDCFHVVIAFKSADAKLFCDAENRKSLGVRTGLFEGRSSIYLLTKPYVT